MAARKNFAVAYEAGLNLREEASKEAKILAVLPFGEKVTIDPKADVPEGWAAVSGGGFVMKEYLR